MLVQLLELAEQSSVEVLEAGGASSYDQVLGNLLLKVLWTARKRVMHSILDAICPINSREEQFGRATLDLSIKKERLSTWKRVLELRFVIILGGGDPAAPILDISNNILSIIAFGEVGILLICEISGQLVHDMPS